MDTIEDKVAVVTGAASGIGRALAGRFATEGAKVVLADVEVEALEKAAAEIEGTGAEVLAVPTDVSDGQAVEALRDAAVERFGAVHVVCNNAGVASGGTLWTATDEDWGWVLGVNLMGVVHGVQAFTPLMIEQGEGHIVNTASIAGMLAPPFMGIYNATKHAVVALSESLHGELALFAPGVGVSVLCPGWVEHPHPRVRPQPPRGGRRPDRGGGRRHLRGRLQGGRRRPDQGGPRPRRGGRAGARRDPGPPLLRLHPPRLDAAARGAVPSHHRGRGPVGRHAPDLTRACGPLGRRPPSPEPVGGRPRPRCHSRSG